MTTFNMTESPQGPDPKRLLLAIVATSAVLMAYSYFFADSKQAPAEKVSPPVTETIKSDQIKKILIP